MGFCLFVLYFFPTSYPLMARLFVKLLDLEAQTKLESFIRPSVCTELETRQRKPSLF